MNPMYMAVSLLIIIIVFGNVKAQINFGCAVPLISFVLINPEGFMFTHDSTPFWLMNRVFEKWYEYVL